MDTTENKKTGSYKINWNVYAERVDGDISVEATVAKFERDLKSYLEMQTKDQPAIFAAIDAVLAEAAKSGGALNKPALITFTLSHLGFTTDTFKSLEERVKHAIETNPRYYSVKGAGGGVRRMSDDEFTVFEATGKNPADLARDAKKNAKA